jgi:hypothetical protein
LEGGRASKGATRATRLRAMIKKCISLNYSGEGTGERRWNGRLQNAASDIEVNDSRGVKVGSLCIYT